MRVPFLQRNRLATKLGLGFLFLLALPVVIITLDNLYRVSSYEREMIAGAERQTLFAQAQAIRNLLLEPVSDVLFLSSATPTQRFLQHAASPDATTAGMEAFLVNYIQRSVLPYHELSMLNENGHPMLLLQRTGMDYTRDPDIPESYQHRYRKAFEGAMHLSAIRGRRVPVHIQVHCKSAPENTPPHVQDLHLIDYSVLLRNAEGIIRGVFILSLDGNALLDDTLASLGIQNGVVLNPEGEIINNTTQSPTETRVLRLLETPYREDILREEQARILSPPQVPGWSYFSTRIHPPGQSAIQWTLLSEIPEDVLNQQTTESRRALLLAAGASLFVAAILVVLFTRRTVEPIRRLAEATRRIGPGDWRPALPAAMTSDEVGDLVRGFSSMASRLHELHSIQENTAENLRITLHSIGEGVIVTDPQGAIVGMNPIATQMTGEPETTARGLPFENTLHVVQDHSREPLAPRLRAFLVEGGTSMTLHTATLVRPDGREIPVAVTIGTMHDNRKRLLGAVLVMRDQTEQRKAALVLERMNEELESRVQERTEELQATNEELTVANEELQATSQKLLDEIEERRQAEEALVRAERMAAVGTLAAGVAHEFNNINVIVIGFVQLILMEEESLPEGVADKLGRVLNAAKRAADITKNLVTFAGQSRPSFRNEDINTVVEQTLDLVEKTLANDGIAVERELAPMPPCHMDPSRLGQVILNLLINAQHALLGREDKRIHIRTHATEKEIFLEVSDNGCGIEQGEISRIFTPFFSTKGEHAKGDTPQSKVRGTGLGLSVCLKIVNDHHGRIHVESEKGCGTTFRIHLPRQVRMPELPPLALVSKPKRKTAIPAALCAGQRVLVLDDEPDVLEFATLSLRVLGCKIEAFREGSVALQRLQTGRFDLILLDMIMPSMTGLQFIERLKALRLESPPGIIVMTGRPLKDVHDDLGDHPDAVLIRKPFSQEDLIDAIHKALSLS